MIRFLFASGAMLIAFGAAAQSFVVPPELLLRSDLQPAEPLRLEVLRD